MLTAQLGNYDYLLVLTSVFCFTCLFDSLLFIYGVCSLLAIAEETLAEFLSKATGTAVDWVQMVGMKVCARFSHSDNIVYSQICRNDLCLC